MCLSIPPTDSVTIVANKTFDAMLRDLDLCRIEHKETQNLQTLYSNTAKERDQSKATITEITIDRDKWKTKAKNRFWLITGAGIVIVSETIAIIALALK